MVSRMAYSTWTPQKHTHFDGHYLRNRSTLDIGVLSYIGIVQHKENSPEVLSISSGTPCICSDKFNFQFVFKLCIVIYYIVLCGCLYIISCVVNCNL